jgi:hypothetical protein
MYKECKNSEELKEKEDQYIKDELENKRKKKLQSDEIIFTDEEVEEEITENLFENIDAESIEDQLTRK